MAKDITVQEKGTAENYSGVAHIEVPSQDSGDVEFVPEDDFKTGVKEITENGTYYPASDGLGGYTAVIVNVRASSLVGTNKSDGQQYTVSKSEDGEIVYVPVI